MVSDNFDMDLIYVCGNCLNVYDFIVINERVFTFTGNIDETGAEYNANDGDREIICRQCNSIIDEIYILNTEDLTEKEMAVIQRVRKAIMHSQNTTENNIWLEDRKAMEKLLNEKGEQI